MNDSNIEIKFQDIDLQHINEYYWSKAQIGGDMYMRQILTKYMTLHTQKEAQDSFHSLHLLLLQKINDLPKETSLPDWFLKYEEKEIEYSTIASITSLANVRKRIFGIVDSIDVKPDLRSLQLNPEDEMALTTKIFLQSLPSSFSTTDSAKSDLEPAERMHMYFEESKLLKNLRIRDVFRSFLFSHMCRSSSYYPDSLVAKVKNGISKNMQPFVDRIETKYNQFNGTPAPPFYLKDSTII
ncbi:MAG: hypothetical protein IPL46_17540 [Saprospiraceae bacterium]|nr:hypothetical protein [Saprospiraceae bacterium]